MHRKRTQRIWKKTVEFLARKKKVDFHLLAEALWQVRTWFGADGKVSIERWYLSPYVEKLLNSKVIKSFIHELRSRKCFSCFGIPMLSMSVMNILCTYPYHGYGTFLNLGYQNKSPITKPIHYTSTWKGLMVTSPPSVN